MAEREYHSLHPIQKGLAFLFDFYPDMTILNLAVRMDFDEPVNEALLIEAIRETGRRLPYLQLRMHREEGQPMQQYLSDEEPETPEVADLSSCSEEEIATTLYNWTLRAFPNSILDTQLYFFRLLHLPGGKQGLYFCGEHFIMDGYALLYLLNYVDKVYAALCDGAELPAPGSLPWKMIEDAERYLASEGYQRELAKCAKKFETEPQFTSLNGLGSPEFIEGKRYGKSLGLDQLDGGCLLRSIPASLAARIDAAAKAAHISPASWYTLALRSYLGYVCNTDDVTFITGLSLRMTTYQKHAGMEVSTQQLLRTVIPGETRFGDAVLQMSDAQNNLYRHPQAQSVHLSQILSERFGVPFGCGYTSAMFSYMPLYDLGQNRLKFHPHYVTNGQANQGFYWLVLPESTSGDLCATYTYSTAYTDPANIERFHAFMLRFLENGLDAPEKTLRELIDESL